jgi:hypothetical protein
VITLSLFIRHIKVAVFKAAGAKVTPDGEEEKKDSAQTNFFFFRSEAAAHIYNT